VRQLTGYFDESGTHGGASVSGTAGFVGDKRQWAKFEKRTGKLFDRYRVKVFHAVDVRRTRKDFEGWSVDRKIEFLDEFQHIINETLESGVAAFISEVDYDYYRQLEWPRGTRHDSKYGILFPCVLVANDRRHRQPPMAIEPRLRFVLEDGHANGGDAMRIYDWAQDRMGQHKALSGLAFNNKDGCLPLAAADLFAYSSFVHGVSPIGMRRAPFVAWCIGGQKRNSIC
jgi:hypothetical protein